VHDDDWVFLNRIKKGKTMKPGPIWHETILVRRVQPVARKLGLPHITWPLLRHWGVTSMIRAKMELPAVQQRVGHSRAYHSAGVLRRGSSSFGRRHGRGNEWLVEQWNSR
jgi:integrase